MDGVLGICGKSFAAKKIGVIDDLGGNLGPIFRLHINSITQTNVVVIQMLMLGTSNEISRIHYFHCCSFFILELCLSNCLPQRSEERRVGRECGYGSSVGEDRRVDE